MSERADIEALIMLACQDEGAQAVADKVLELMAPNAAKLWLEGHDGHLGGAQPIVVLKLEGSQPVLAALQAFEEGASRDLRNELMGIGHVVHLSALGAAARKRCIQAGR